MIWREAGAVRDLDNITPTGNFPVGTFNERPTTTAGGGTGLTVSYQVLIANTPPSSFTIINPGSGYEDDDIIVITGGELTATVNGVSTENRWEPDSLETVGYIQEYVSQNAWIDGGHATSNFGGAPAVIEGGNANSVYS